MLDLGWGLGLGLLLLNDIREYYYMRFEYSARKTSKIYKIIILDYCELFLTTKLGFVNQ